jgi:hypothetical protein
MRFAPGCKAKGRKAKAVGLAERGLETLHGTPQKLGGGLR